MGNYNNSTSNGGVFQVSEELDKVPIRQEIAGEIYAVIDAHARANGIKVTTAIEGILRRWAIKELHRMRLAEIFLRRKGSDRQRPAEGGSGRQRPPSNDSYRQATDNAWDQALRALAGKGNFGVDTDAFDPADYPETLPDQDTE